MSTAGHTSDRILAYGCDAILLNTRCMVLEKAGFHVDAASSTEEFQERIVQATLPYRLLLLGHSISPMEQSRIMASFAESATVVYQLAELTPPLKLISDLHELLRNEHPKAP